jgi:hypothetical protein
LIRDVRELAKDCVSPEGPPGEGLPEAIRNGISLTKIWWIKSQKQEPCRCQGAPNHVGVRAQGDFRGALAAKGTW